MPRSSFVFRLSPFGRLRRIASLCALSVFTLASVATAQTASDTAAAQTMLSLGQTSLLRAAAEKAKGTPAEFLYRSQVTMAEFDGVTSAAGRSVTAGAYMDDLTRYLDSNPVGIDGPWAIAQAKFLIGTVAQPIVSRMELWSATPVERRRLAQIAALADRCLLLARAQLKTAMAAGENTKPFDDPTYTQLYSADMEAGYDRAYALYFRAMAIDPADKDPQRLELLRQSVAAVNEWADGDEANGVKLQSLLLRGKALAAAGQFDGALKDFQLAEQRAGAEWIKYQSLYQIVVVRIAQGDLAAAKDGFLDFSNHVAAQNASAAPDVKATNLAGVDILHYRLAAAQAAALPPGQSRNAARDQATGVLSHLIERDSRFRELVYEQLALAAGPAPAVADCPVLQQLAIAWSSAQKLPGDAGAPAAWQNGVDAARAVIQNASAAPADKLEALLIAGVCFARLNQPEQAARVNLQFVEAAPNDPRAKQVVEVALGQIGALRQAGKLTDEMSALAERALAIATDRFGEKHWFYARGILLQEQGKTKEAAAALAQVPADDESYLDARYRILLIKINDLTPAEGAPTAAEQRAAAGQVVQQCAALVDLIKAAPPALRDPRKGYIVQIRLVQAGTLLDPLGDPAGALAALDAVDRESLDLTLAIQPATLIALLRDRVIALYKLEKTDDLLRALDRLHTQSKEKAVEIARGLVSWNVAQVAKLESTDPDHAKSLAAATAAVLDRLIPDADPADLYRFRQLQADMLARGGKPMAAAKLWHELQLQSQADLKAGKRPEDDLLNYIGEARALQADHEYAEARKCLNDILPKVEPGSEPYWETYLRILQCMQAQGADPQAIRQPLHDLHAAYGETFGGQKFKAEYEALDKRYNP